MPKPRRDSGARPSALFLSPEAPYPLVGGGAIRSASLLEYLAPRYDVDVAVFREPGAPDPAAAFPPCLVRDIHVLDLPFHRKDTIARAGRNLRRFLLSRPPLNDRFGGFGDTLAEFLRGRDYDVAVIEHFWCAEYCEQIAGHANCTVLDLHNIESVLHARCAETEAWPASVLLRRFRNATLELERRWLPRFSLLLATSDDDARRIRKISPDSKICVYPNALPPIPTPAVPEEDVLVFSGNLEYHPNVAAVRHFRRRIWPLLRERWPGLRWRIIGRNVQGIAAHIDGDERIEVTGAIADAVAALAHARVVVVPLLSGSGTRVKILEAWAAARPVVSTTLGAEGLGARDGEHLLLADTPEAFASAVSRLLESQALRARVAAAGRALYEADFAWPSAWKTLEATPLGRS